MSEPTLNNYHLAEPFSKIFTGRAEAEWAFDLLREATRRLRVIDPYDPRVAMTLSTRSGRPFLHLNFGNWLVLGFRGPGQVDMALLANLVAWDERFTSFAADRKEGEPEVRSYHLPLEMVRPLTSNLKQAFETTLDFIADKFATWKRSPHWKQHNPELVEAFFDPEKRSLLLAGGLEEPELRYERHYTAFDYELAEEGEEYGDEEIVSDANADGRMRVKSITDNQLDETTGFFTEQTFELLADLHADPTKDFYLAHKEKFKNHVEEPFQQLFHQVTAQLPSAITDTMETEKYLFGRILKNDFGQGGAWDFYWGALYPKGGKRAKDTQLSIWMNHERFPFGFYIGDYGTKPRKRFLRNCQENYEELVSLLGDVLSNDKFVFGSHEDIFIGPDGSVSSRLDLTWQEWLKNPDQADYDISVVYPKNKLLSLSASKLIEQITQTFIEIFPLNLLAINDDPLPLIRNYLRETVSQPPHLPVSPPPNPPYPLSQLAEETGFSEDDLARWVRAIERKGQAVLYGPPGTGKTFLAEKLAQHLIGGGDGFRELVQFHPAYAYEDFMQGIRPHTEAGSLSYQMMPGRFLEFCRRAGSRTGTCVLIIDEINRANLSRVFGELMYLLEYREQEIPLAGGNSFRIPQNVRLIGTMNTADRSIALVDHALRRRFAFIALWPNFEVLRRYHRRHNTGFPLDGLIDVLTRLNGEIGDHHYHVGITFFLHQHLNREIADIWQMEIEPYLEEYFFDRPEKAADFSWSNVRKEILP